jgi:hypothetical protein
LTVKTYLIFGKRFTVLKTLNRFPKLNASFLHARSISNCRNSAIVGRRNLASVEIWQHLTTENLPVPESGDIQSSSPELWSEAGQILPKWPGSGQIWIDPAIYMVESDQIRMSPAKIRPFWPNPTKPTHQNPATATGSCRIPTTVA